MHTKFDVLCLYPKAIYLFQHLKTLEYRKLKNKMFHILAKMVLKQKQKIESSFFVCLLMNDFILREVYKSQLNVCSSF